MNYTAFAAKAQESMVQDSVDAEHFYLQLSASSHETYAAHMILAHHYLS